MVAGQISKCHQTVQGSHGHIQMWFRVCWGQELFMQSLMTHIHNAVPHSDMIMFVILTTFDT